MATVNMDRLLEACWDMGASDIHLTVNRPPVLRIDGGLRSLETKVLEPDDPDFAETCFGLAHMCHRHSGRLDEADALYDRAIAIWEKTLPPDDPFLLVVLNEYVDLLRERNRDDEAKAVEARIPLESRTSTSSLSH